LPRPPPLSRSSQVEATRGSSQPWVECFGVDLPQQAGALAERQELLHPRHLPARSGMLKLTPVPASASPGSTFMPIIKSLQPCLERAEAAHSVNTRQDQQRGQPGDDRGRLGNRGANDIHRAGCARERGGRELATAVEIEVVKLSVRGGGQRAGARGRHEADRERIANHWRGTRDRRDRQARQEIGAARR